MRVGEGGKGGGLRACVCMSVRIITHMNTAHDRHETFSVSWQCGSVFGELQYVAVRNAPLGVSTAVQFRIQSCNNPSLLKIYVMLV